MDVAAISQLISTLGFPIIACCYMAYSNEKLRKTLDENTKAIESLKSLIILHNYEQHKTEKE